MSSCVESSVKDPERSWRAHGRPGAGALVALALLLAAEASLHSDTFLYRFRSVFAAGRALDKVIYVERHTPKLLIIGNSRVDNGIDPATVAERIQPGMTAFNLGLPGANASALHGVVRRIDEHGGFAQGRIEYVLIGLDESLLQRDDALGYGVFFPSRTIGSDNFAATLRGCIRLWGYADNLRQLREPATLARFLRATVMPIDPVGGGAAARLGYRPGFTAKNQDAEQVMRQEAGSTAPPDRRAVEDFWTMLDLLRERGIRIAIVFPPLLTRPVLFLDPGNPAAEPYRRIRRQLASHGIPMFALNGANVLTASEFLNAGHLNDTGAQRFSAMLGNALARNADRNPRLERVSAQ